MNKDLHPRSLVSCENLKEGESPIFQHSTTFIENGGKLISTFRCIPEANTVCKLIKAANVKYGKFPCIGEREKTNDGNLGKYRWISYSEFYIQVKRFAAGLQMMGLKKGDKVGIYSVNCPWWQRTAFACYVSSLVPVPIYDSLGPGAAEYILEHSECIAVVVSQEKLGALRLAIQSTNENKIRNVMVIGDFQETNENGISYQSCDSVYADEGKLDDFQFLEPEPDDLGMIMYTSGSTGKPKGCLLTHRNIIAGATGLGCLGCSITPSDTYFSFLPLAHIYALGVEIIMFAQGASIGYYSGSIKNLLDDIASLKPTIICGVPRVWNRIVDGMKTKISQLPQLLQTILSKAMKWKIKQFRENKPYSMIMDTVLFGKFRASLGGRVRLIVSGGAPILPEIYDFLAVTLTPNIVNGYGLTEVCASVSVSEIPTTNAMNIGAVSITSEVKLRAVEGFKYDPRGNPMCGEVMIRGPHVFQGYYKDEQLTREVLDEDGWFASGDIGSITSSGGLQIIDRVKQLIKLSQGEYISLSSLSDIYGNTDGVQNIYVYADSHQDSPLAVVIPDKALIDEWKQSGITDLENSSVAKNEIISRLDATASKSNLRRFERINRILIDTEEFSIDNGLLTPSMKPQWQSLRKKYEAKLLKLAESK